MLSIRLVKGILKNDRFLKMMITFIEMGRIVPAPKPYKEPPLYTSLVR